VSAVTTDPAAAAAEAEFDPAQLIGLDAPGRLAVALAAAGTLARAQRLLRQAGYPVSITSGRNDEALGEGGLYAAHPVNVPDAGWSYSARNSPGHEACCALRPRGLYQGTRLAGALPYVHARLMIPDGRVSVALFLMSATPAGPRAVITWDQVDRGRVYHRLGIPASKSPRVREALTTAIITMAYDSALPERPHALSPSSRTPDGRIPAPEWSTLPPGYGDQPSAPAGSAARTAARAAQARIAAGSPQVALVMGASIAGPFAAATGTQSSLWELVSGPRAGKTTTVQLAAAMWGRPALPPEPGILMSWDASAKGMGRVSGYLGTLPLFADESGTADFAPAEWARFAYGQTQGASRLTSSVDGEPRRTPGWQGNGFLSGNGSITEGVRSGKFAGIPARVLTLQGPFTASAADCDALADAVATDYGYLGSAVIGSVTVAKFRQWQKEARTAIGGPDGGTLGTNATQLAAAVAGARAADTVLGTGEALQGAALAAARDYLTGTAEPETNREIALRTLAERLTGSRPSWPDRTAYETTGKPDDTPGLSRRMSLPLHGVASDIAGTRDADWVYVLPATWDALVADTGITSTLALADMYQRGELSVAASWRAKGEWRTPGPRWMQPRPNVYKVRLSAITDATPDDDTAEPAPEPAEPAVRESAPAPVQEALPEPAEPSGGGWGPDTIGAAAQETGPAATQPAPAAAVPSPPAAPPADTDPRTAWLAATWERRGNREHFKTPERRTALARITALLDEAPAVDDKDAVTSLADRLQLLAEMEGRGQEFGGPFMPVLRGRPAWLRPWKRGGVPVPVELAKVIEGYNFERDDYHGPVTVFDRNGAWIGAIGTTLVAHGGLEHTGECEPAASSTLPGYYLVNAYEWREPGMPSPLGNGTSPGTQVWVTAPTMGLLAELAAAGRWPDATALDAWTGTPVRLDAWGRLIRELRRYALETHGYGSGAYQAAKDAVSKSVSMMNGTMADDSTRPVRVWAKCKNQRIDWRHQVITNSAVFTWRCMDRCRALADGNPDLAPVGIRAKDELLIPAAAAELVTTQPYPGGTRPPVRLDPTGVELGTFKVKGEETR
jgi:Domain of unknown function (DUF927)